MSERQWTENRCSVIAKGNDGRTYTVIEQVEMTEIHAFQSEPQRLEGLRKLVTSDGQPLHHRGKGKYETMSGTVLQSSDPKAP